MKEKSVISVICILIPILFIGGCGIKQETSSSLTTSSVETEIIETGVIDSVQVIDEVATDDLIGLEINGTSFSFPLRIDELSDDLIVSPILYSEPDDYTLCRLSTVEGIEICSVFVEGKNIESTDSRITAIIVDEMSENISFRGLNYDSIDSYIEQYGTPNDKSDTLIEYVWEEISFIITFDSTSKKADYINLLFTQ